MDESKEKEPEVIKKKIGRPVGWRKSIHGAGARGRLKLENVVTSLVKRNIIKRAPSRAPPRPAPAPRRVVLKKKKKPPGKPWQKTTSANRTCLLCLKRYDESFRTEVLEIDIADSDDDCVVIPQSTSEPDLIGTTDKTGSSVKEVKIPKASCDNLYIRFLKIISQYLKINTTKFRKSAEKNSLCPPFCKDCTNTIEKLCDIYAELQHAKLNLFWKLNQVNDVIKLSKSKMSGKLRSQVLKSLSTQLHVCSSRVVDIFRRQLSIQCGAKVSGCASPKVSIDRNSCINATKDKLLFPFEHIKQYLKSLIVVFTLAVPPSEEKCLPKIEAHRNGGSKKTKTARHARSSKENVPPNGLKLEHSGKEVEEGDDNPDGDDGCFGGDDGCPSPPASDNEDRVEGAEGEKHGSDSDWSMNAIPSGNESAGSDVEFSVKPTVFRRWNLRKRRKTRLNGGNGDGDREQDGDDDDYTPTLPPLRAPKGSKARDESEMKFSCNLCSRKFGMERSLKRHLDYSHSFLMQYKCSKCGLNFKKRKELDLHYRNVHKAKLKRGESLPYMGISTSCTVCQKIFPSKSKMLLHRKSHKVMEMKFACELCGRKMIGKPRFERHMRSHENPTRAHQCSKCPRSFSTVAGLEMHLRVHAERPDWIPGTPIKRNSKIDGSKEIFKCEIEGCDKIFYKRSNRFIHMAFHESSFSCTLCGETFTTLKDFRKHLTNKHETEQKNHFCLHCDKAFTETQTYDLHRKIAHPTKVKIPCDEEECTEEFDTKEQLRDHIKQAHLPQDFDESLALINATEETPPENAESQGQVCKVEQTLPNKDSAEETKLGLYTCARCQWSFCQKYQLVIHKIAHTPRDEHGMFRCTEKDCESSFRVVDTLQTHFNRLHGPQIKPYKCKCGCNGRYFRKESLILHLKTRSTNGPVPKKSENVSLECFKCSKTFTDRSSYTRHIRKGHANMSRKCDECDAELRNRERFLWHKHKEHGMELEFRCEICGKGFITNSTLKYHMISHAEPTLQCPMCPKKFRRQIHLSEHILTHTQEKNYYCEYCGKAFARSKSLSIHLVIHSTEKKFKCSYCDKRFSRKFPRDCHERIHTKEKPYSCKYCEKKFSQHSSLRAHTKIHERLNSDAYVRVPYRQCVATGNPLNERQVNETEAHAESNHSETYQRDNESVKSEHGDETNENSATASGIIHEALKAAFDDINLDLEESSLKDEPIDTHNEHMSSGQQNLQLENNIGGHADAVSDLDGQVEEPRAPSPPQKRRRGRPPKSKNVVVEESPVQVTKSNLSCGFCGKAFRREKPYKAHVDRHLADALLERGTEGNPENSRSNDINIRSSSNQQEQSRTFINEMQATVHRPFGLQTEASTSESFSFASQPSLSTPEQLPRKGRKPSNKNQTPGSRLAQIVEEVIGAANNNQFRTSSQSIATSTSTSNGSFSASSPHSQHFHQQSQQPSPVHHVAASPSPHPAQSPHGHVQSPQSPQLTHSQSPHLVQSGSERSTPAGSPATHLHQSNHIATNLPFPATSFLSPFLLTNPYLIPRHDQSQQQQSQLQTTSIIQQQQQQQQPVSYIPTTMQTRQPNFSQSTQQYQQYQQQQQTSTANNLLPQDLSKSGYAMFYTNQR